MLASLRLDAKILSTPKIKNELDSNPNRSYSTYYSQHHLLLSVHLHDCHPECNEGSHRRISMGMTGNGLSYWQAETSGEPLLDVTIGDLLDQRANELPAQEAVVYSCYPEFGGLLDIRWTYREYRERANQVARGLIALGLNKGDHIAIWAANLPEWLLLYMAAAKAGLVLVTVNPVLRAQEVEYILKQGDVVALFFMARVRDHDCLATLLSLITPDAKHGEV